MKLLRIARLIYEDLRKLLLECLSLPRCHSYVPHAVRSKTCLTLLVLTPDTKCDIMTAFVESFQ